MNADIQRMLETLRDHPQDREVLGSLASLLEQPAVSSTEVPAQLDASREHHRALGEWAVVLGLVELELRICSDPGRRVELLRQKGRVLKDELLDEEGAIRTFEQVLALQPEDAKAQEDLAHIRLVRENWEKIAAKYVEEAQDATDRQLATSLFVAAAEVLWCRLPDSPRVEEYLRRALEVDPRSRKASAHLERWLRQAGRFKEVAELLEQRASVAVSREERVSAFLAAGELWGSELRQADSAADYFRRALALDPANPRALRHLVGVLTAQEAWPQLVRVYEDALRAQPRGETEAGTLLQIGQIYGRKLGELDKAEEYFRRVRKLDPAQPVMLEFYREWYRHKGEPAKVLALLDAAQRAVTDVARRTEIVRQMAEVAEQEGGNLEKAIDLWKGLQRADPRSSDASKALRRLYRRTSPPKWNALRELLKDEIDALGEGQTEEKIRLLFEVVEIYRDHLKLDVMVINTYHAILALKPDHAEALAALAEKYETMGRWNDLIALLQRRKELEWDVARRIELLHRIAAIWVERLGNQGQATVPLQEILSLDPTEERASGQLRQIYEKRRSWRQLLDLLRAEAAHRDPTGRRALQREMAHLAAERIGDVGEAIQVWNEVLADDASDEEALRALGELYRREERWPAYAEVLHRQLESAGANEGQAVLLLERLGDLYAHHLEAPGNAMATWKALLALRPSHGPALASLRELLVRERRWEELEEFLGERGQYGELAEALTVAADRSEDAELKVRLYRRVGQLCQVQLKSAERAIKAYERVLAVDPEHVEVCEILVPLYQAGAKWGRLLSTYETLLQHAAEESEQLRLLGEIRQLCERQLGSKQLAFHAAARAFALTPDDAAAKAELERLAVDSDAWEELLDVYQRQLDGAREAPQQRVWLRQLAELAGNRLRRPELAEQFYRRLLAASPEDRGCLAALEQIYSSTQRWVELVEVCERQAAAETAVRTRVDLLFKVAYLQEERLGDPLAAIRTYQAIAAVDPANLRALKALERLHQVRGSWPELVEVLGRELEHATGKDAKVDLHYRMGEILANSLGDRAKAIQAYAEALALDPVHRGTVVALEAQLGAPGDHQVIVARLLRPFYDRTEEWPKLVRVVQTLLEGERDPAERLNLLKRLQSLYTRRLDQPEGAFEMGLEILVLDPADTENRRELAALADRLGRHEAHALALAEVLATLDAQRSALELPLRWELAQVFDDKLGKPERAEPELRRILVLHPIDAAASTQLERILRDGARWGEVRDLLHQRLEVAEALAARREILIQLCALNEDALGDTDAAIGTYEALLRLSPDHAPALRALQRLYREAGRWSELDELLGRETELASDPQVIDELRFRRAEVRVTKLGNAAGAVELLEAVLARDPEHDGTLALLEGLLGEPGLEERVARALERAFEHRKEWEKLVAVLLLRRGLSADRHEVLELLARAAALQEDQLGNHEAAFATLQQAVLLEPTRPEFRQGVDRLATQLGRFEEAAETWRKSVELVPVEDLTLRGELLASLGYLEEERLGQPDRARATFERLLALDPDHLPTAQPAAAALVRLYERSAQWVRLVEVLGMQLRWAEDAATRCELLQRMAQVQEEMQRDPDRAIETYRQLLDEDPANERALDALERLYTAAHRYRDLIEILRRRVERASPEARRGLWVRIAELWEHQLGDRDEATAAYLTILDAFPTDVPSLSALARLYRVAQGWLDLLEMIERLIPLVPEEERLALHLQAAALQHRELANPGAAIDRYRKILELAPDNEPARLALEELLEEPACGATVAEILADLYARRQRVADLIRIRELQAQRAEHGERVRMLRSVAAIYEEQLEDLPRAFEAYQRALRASVSEGELPAAVREVRRLGSQLERWSELVEVVEGILPEVLDAELQRELRLEVAALARDRLGDSARARQHFLQVLESEPGHAGALTSLEELYQAQGQWEALYEVLQRKLELEAGSEARIELLLRAAVLCRDALSRPSAAIAEYERVLELEPNHSGALEALDPLYAGEGRWQDLAALLERRIPRATDPERQVALTLRLAKLRAEELADPAQALRAYRDVLRLDPDRGPAVAAVEAYLEDAELRAEAARVLEPLYAARQQWPSLIRIYEIRLAAAEDAEARLALATRVAQLYEEQLEDLDGAFVWYGKVFLDRPEDHSLRDQLIRLAGILDRWRELAEVFGRYLEQVEHPTDHSRTITLLVGMIFEERLQEWEPARDFYQRMWRHDRTDVEAFGQLERLLTRFDRWHELLELYREAADDALDPGLRRELILKVARVWEEALENLPEAIEAYRSVLEQDEQDPEPLAALDRLYTQTGRFEDLCALLQRQLEFERDPVILVERKYRLGTIHEQKLRDLPTAIDFYEEVLARNRDHLPAIAALERLVLDRDQRFRIAQILEPVYRAQDEWAKLVVIYDAQLEFIDDRDRRVELLKEIARLHEERGGFVELAFRALARAFEEQFGDEGLLAGLERLAARLGNWGELVALLDRGAAGDHDAELRAQIHARSAELREAYLGDKVQAVEAWRRVLAVREEDTRALDELVRLLDELERYDELVEILARKADVTVDGAAQRAVFARQAEVFEQKLSSPERAIEAWQKALAIEEDWPALEALDRLHTVTGNWARLVEICRRKLELGGRPEEERGLLLRMAETYETRLAQPAEAISSYATLVQRDPADRGALEALDRLYTQERQWVELLEILDLKTGLAGPSAEASGLTFRAGAVLWHELGDPGAAIDRFATVVAADPHHEAARDALEQLLQDEGHRGRVADVLETLYVRTGEMERLAAVLEARLRGTEEVGARLSLLRRLAELRELQLEDPRGAFGAYLRAFAEEPGDDRVRAEVARLAGSLGCHDERAAAYEERLTGVFDSVLGRTLHLEAAALAEERLGDLDAAERHYRAALECGGDELVPLRALDALLTRRERWAPLAEVLERLAPQVGGATEQAELLARLGRLRLEQLHEVPGAFAALRDALGRDPAHSQAAEVMERLLSHDAHRVAVLDVLEPIFEQARRFEKLVELLEVRLTTLAASEDRVGLLERIGWICEQELGQPARAMEALGRALACDPGNLHLLDELEALAVQLGQFAGLVELGRQLLAQGLEAEAARELGLRMASLCLDKVSDLAGAAEMFRDVLEVSPAHPTALGALERIYRATGETARLAEVLWQRSEAEYDVAPKRGLLAEVARLREAALDDPAGAIVAWRAILDLDEGDADAQEALARLYEQSKQWELFLEALERQIRYADQPARQVELRHRAAEAALTHFGDADRAVDFYRDVLDLDPDEPVALAALRRIYSEREDWSSVEEILLRQLEQRQGEAAQALRVELADLAERQGNLEGAAEQLQHVLRADPTSGVAWDRLEEVLRRAEKWRDAVELLRRRAEQLSLMDNEEAATQCLLAAARLYTQQLEDPEAAAGILESLLRQNPQHVGALSELARIYEAGQQWPRCLEILEQARALGPQAREAAELEHRLGRVRKELGEPAERVQAHYERALELDPENADAARDLEALARQRGDWARVASLLERRAEKEGAAGQLELFRELGRLYAERLGRPDAAAKALSRARELRPDDAEILAALAEAHIAANRLDEAAPLLQALIDKAGSRRNRSVARYHHFLGVIAERGGDLAGARTAYEQANRVDSTFAPTLVALGTLYMAHEEWEAARRIYRTMLLQNSDEGAGVSRSEVFYRLGRVHAALGETSKALGMYERGLEAEPGRADLQAAIAELKGR
ncbi:MAG: tetratricopeptide repeat protein [Deltaproteobacteria bacterium]|nr:tetratricopeptide repeat protein [Deltaproteobacteria bacterium]